MNSDIRSLLEGIQNGSVSVDDALLQLKQQPFEDIGYAKVDMHRKIRQGAGEVIYGGGKTAQQIIGILTAMIDHGQQNVLITRLDAQKLPPYRKATQSPTTRRPESASWDRWKRPTEWAPLWWPPAAPATCPWPRKPP